MAATPPANLATNDSIDETWVDAVRACIVELQPTAWVAPVLSGTWINFGAPYQVAQYRIVGDRVELRGVVKSGAVGSTIFMLPAGFRPPGALQFATVAGGAFGYLLIATDGTVAASVGAVASFDLAPVRFSVTP